MCDCDCDCDCAQAAAFVLLPVRNPQPRLHIQLNHVVHAATSALPFLLACASGARDSASASRCQPLHLSNQPIGPFSPAEVCGHYAGMGQGKDSGCNVWSESGAGHMVSAFGFCAIACLQTHNPTSSDDRITCQSTTVPVVCCNFFNDFDVVQVCKGVEGEVLLFIYFHRRGPKKGNKNKNTTKKNKKKYCRAQKW